MKHMKKSFFLFATFILIASFFVIFIHYFSKKEETIQQPLSMKVVSSLKEQIQPLNDVRLDRIVVDIEYQIGHQNLVVTKEMISEEDSLLLKEVGKHNITICYEQLNVEVPIVLYDETVLSNNNIYYIEDDSKDIVLARDISEIAIPKKKNQFFYGWKISNDDTIGNDKILSITPKWSKEQVYQVDFYLQDELLKRQYVLADEEIIYPQIDNPSFVAWDYEEKTTNEDRIITPILLKQNQVFVRFNTVDGDCIDYQILEKGQDCVNIPQAPLIDGQVFYTWSHDLKNITESTDCYPIYYKENERFQVKFFNSSLEFLYATYVNAGEPAVFNYPENDEDYVSGYSVDVSHVYSDMEVIVFFARYLDYYYIDNKLWQVAGYELINVPEGYMKSDGTYVHNDGTWYWKKREGTKNVYDLITGGQQK